MKATVTRKTVFNAAHRLHNPKWDDDTNKKIFGLCNNPNYHGHNYTLLVHITGEIDLDTGYVMDLKVLSDLIHNHIEEKFDHRNLNLDLPEFKTLIPSAENIAKVIWEILRKLIQPEFDLKVTLFETEKNSVEFSGQL
jgi:6-pyruvoyltetrahydropterin/6-carboxytetrahydropterin synthase